VLRSYVFGSAKRRSSKEMGLSKCTDKVALKTESITL